MGSRLDSGIYLRHIPPLLPLLLSGCLINVGPGPDLGTCANPPEGVYTYGEIGIGTCVSGPGDMEFFEQDGKTWLAVSNADPYRNFSGGSLLLIDFDSIDFTVERNILGDLEAYSLATEPYVGGIGYVADRKLMLLTGRYSEDARTRDYDDRVFVIDVSDPQNPQPWSEGDELRLKDDPFPIVVNGESGQAYIVNLTDHSISVIDTTTTPLEVVDIAAPPQLDSGIFTDLDTSGSLAELAGLTIQSTKYLTADQWTLSWVDGTYRIWAPTDDGYVRWSTGDQENYVQSAYGLDLFPELSSDVTAINDPSMSLLGGLLMSFFSDNGTIRSATQGTIGVGDWVILDTPYLVGGTGWDADLGGPIVLSIEEIPTMFYDGRSGSGGASIGVAYAEDGEVYIRHSDAVLTPPSGESYEDPFVWNDPNTGGLRMWFSHWNGENWTIGLSEGYDTVTWSNVETVLSLDGGHVAAPVVTYTNGRYLMWFTESTGTQWTHNVTWSYDGRDWQDPIQVLSDDRSFDLSQPPRVGLQVDASGSWRIEGANAGVLDGYVAAGAGEFFALENGFSLQMANGQEFSSDILADFSVNGVVPGSFAEINGVDTLFVTTTGDDLRTHIGALQRLNGVWYGVNANVIPAGDGGNEAGADSPVIFGEDGDWTLFYGATDSEGLTTIRRAESSDGIHFSPQRGRVVQSEASFDSYSQLPHSVQITEDEDIRLWYGGSNGNRFHIGAAISTDNGETFAPEPGPIDEYQMSTGQPTDFDDSGVRDPLVFTADGSTQMYYSGFDGAAWNIGHAILEDDIWVRSQHPVNDEALAALSGLWHTFSANGVHSPVISSSANYYEVLYGGFDGNINRVGRAVADLDSPQTLFPTQRFPTVGDYLTFATDRGDYQGSVIELEQSVQAFSTSGIGVAGMTYDEQKGFLYLPSKLASFLYVIDVRDDSDGTFEDTNYLDIETILRVKTITGVNGFRDVIRVGDLLYLTSRQPDGIVVLNLDEIEDNNTKEASDISALAALPLHSLLEDGELDTLATIGGAGIAITNDKETLLATHFRGNGVYAFDLEMGAYGQEVAWIPNIGENPHKIVISPNGRYAVVANYIGEIDELTVSSTLAIIDLEPTSDTYLEVVTWLVNR
ncbi:MAG: hypothetical protein HN348_02355 [Proteobacteria bacterium]|nr:hypothetical protein [Pseudomonadota bacterium]